LTHASLPRKTELVLCCLRDARLARMRDWAVERRNATPYAEKSRRLRKDPKPTQFGRSPVSPRTRSQAVAACREQAGARPPHQSAALALALPRSSHDAPVDLNLTSRGRPPA
jgi:hypothetical protein